MTPRGGRGYRLARLRRALWGVPAGETARIFADQEHHFSVEINRVQSQLNMALAEHHSVRHELVTLSQRLAALQGVVSGLRDKASHVQTLQTLAERPVKLRSVQSRATDEMRRATDQLGQLIKELYQFLPDPVARRRHLKSSHG